MAKPSKGQKETVERVMHEFKHGELKTPAGSKVKNQKQAVAIALSESGSSKYESPKKNASNLRKTKTKERKGDTGQAAAEGRKGAGSGKDRTKADLYAEAKRKDVAGRSTMSKAELERAIRR